MSAVECQVWGSSERVRLVHGSMATGPTEWEAQRPLADEGYERAARPGAVRSLAVAEPPLFSIAPGVPDVAQLREQLLGVLTASGDDRAFLEALLRTVGTPVDELPPDALDELTPFVPAVRDSRPPWEAEVPVDVLREAPFPVLVASGNHPAFTAMCEALVVAIGAEHAVVEGAGHEVQMAAEDFNTALLALWRRAGS